jgi:hypothetical protein
MLPFQTYLQCPNESFPLPYTARRAVFSGPDLLGGKNG